MGPRGDQGETGPEGDGGAKGRQGKPPPDVISKYSIDILSGLRWTARCHWW